MIKQFEAPQEHFLKILNKWEYKKTEWYLRKIEYQQWQCEQEIRNPFLPAAMIHQYAAYKLYLDKQRKAVIRYRLTASV